MIQHFLLAGERVILGEKWLMIVTQSVLFLIPLGHVAEGGGTPVQSCAPSWNALPSADVQCGVMLGVKII